MKRIILLLIELYSQERERQKCLNLESRREPKCHNEIVSVTGFRMVLFTLLTH